MTSGGTEPRAVKPRNTLLLILGLGLFVAGLGGAVFAKVALNESVDVSNVVLGAALGVLAASLSVMLVYRQDKDSRALVNSLARGVKVALTDQQVTVLRPTEDELKKAVEAGIAAKGQAGVTAADIEAAVRTVLREQPQPRPWVRALFFH